MENTHTHQSFSFKSEIKIPWFAAGCLLLKTENQRPKSTIKSQHHQLASERRHHPYNVIPLPSTLARRRNTRVNGRDLKQKIFEAVPCEFKGMVASSRSASYRCLLLVGSSSQIIWHRPPEKNGDFIVMLSHFFKWRNFHCKKIARSQHLAKCRVLFCPIRWTKKRIKPISQHPSFATTKRTWNKVKNPKYKTSLL